jgi:hypothetical protein
MTKIEIEQFLVDHHPQGDTIEVDCIWLQGQLLKKLQLEREAENYAARVETWKARIEMLQEKVDIYKEILEAYRNRKVLNVYI